MGAFNGEYALLADDPVSPAVHALARKMLGRLHYDEHVDVNQLTQRMSDGTVVIAQRVGALYRVIVRAAPAKETTLCSCFDNKLSAPTAVSDVFTPFNVRLDDPAVYGHARPDMAGSLFAVFEDKIYFFANLTQRDMFGVVQGDGRGFVYDPAKKSFSALPGVYETYSSNDYGVGGVGFGYRDTNNVVRFAFMSNNTSTSVRAIYEHTLAGGTPTSYVPDASALGSLITPNRGPATLNFAPVDNSKGAWSQAHFVCAQGGAPSLPTSSYYSNLDYKKRMWSAPAIFSGDNSTAGAIGYLNNDAYIICEQNGPGVGQSYMTQLNMATGVTKKINLPISQFTLAGQSAQTCCCVLLAGGITNNTDFVNGYTTAAWSINLQTGKAKHLGDLPYNASLPGATDKSDWSAIAFPTSKGVVVFSEQFGLVSTVDGARRCILAANINVVT